jgi:uncharacterized protein YbjT (DUF2867 family)
MTTAVVGATGRVGSEIVRGLLARGDAVAALVRDPAKARRTFGEPDGLHVPPTRLDDARDVTEAFDGIRTAFIAMGSIGIEGVVQRIAINAAAGISSIEQVTRSIGAQRLRELTWDQPASPLQHRPARLLDSSAVLDDPPSDLLRVAARRGARGRASRIWTGLADSGRMALIDYRDVAEAGLRVLTDPTLWGAHHDLTGPVRVSWPEALELLSAELGEPVTFRIAAERQFLEGLISAGVPAGRAELLVTREWAILAGENDYTTDTFQQITGRPPRPVAEFLHEYRPEFF